MLGAVVVAVATSTMKKRRSVISLRIGLSLTTSWCARSCTESGRRCVMAKRLCEFNTSSSRFWYTLHLHAWAEYKRGDVPDADEFAYINKRVLDKYPTAEFVQLKRWFVPKADAIPPTKVRWEFEWIVWDYNKEVCDDKNN
jgi:hypothetical protein